MKQKKKATILDVAAMAGVSVGTVSNVLNGMIPVSRNRRERVLKVIHELGYSQNMLARGLRGKRTPVVGICVPQTSTAYFSALMEAFEDVASTNGIEIMQVLSHGNSQKEYHRVESLLRYHVGGLLLVPTIDPEAMFEMVAASDVPVVVIDRPPPANFQFDHVTFDNRTAMYQATQGLIDRGHKNILFIVQQRKLALTQQRIEGLHAAAAASRGAPVVPKVIECGKDQATLAAILAGELRRKQSPTAIIVSNSILAAWVMRALRMLQIDCPKDVSLLAFDQPEWADLVTPALSVVRQPTQDIARTAWTFLMQRMRNEAEGVQQIQLEAQVIFRGSVRKI